MSTYWYGNDCTYPSRGWKANAAHGVGTIVTLAFAPLAQDAFGGTTDQSTCGVACEYTCTRLGDALVGGSNRWQYH